MRCESGSSPPIDLGQTNRRQEGAPSFPVTPHDGFCYLSAASTPKTVSTSALGAVSIAAAPTGAIVIADPIAIGVHKISAASPAGAIVVTDPIAIGIHKITAETDTGHAAPVRGSAVIADAVAVRVHKSSPFPGQTGSMLCAAEIAYPIAVSVYEITSIPRACCECADTP